MRSLAATTHEEIFKKALGAGIIHHLRQLDLPRTLGFSQYRSGADRFEIRIDLQCLDRRLH
jgi:hypothetical protein